MEVIIIYKNTTIIDINDANNYPTINNNVEIKENICGATKKVKCQCRQCGDIFYMDWIHLKRGQSHSRCARHNSKVKPHKIFIEELYKIQPNIILLEKYDGALKKIKCKCRICNTEWSSWANNLLRMQAGCPKCRASIGEYNIAEYLDNRNIIYQRQHTFSDCVDKDLLRFDFYLPEYNLCIEFQGEQHYFPVDFRGHGEKDAQERFNLLQNRDNIKRQYCKAHHIQLIEIKYLNKEYVDIENILNPILNKNP